MSEGSLQAPIRHPIDWQNPQFYDAEDLDRELRRVFDICHGCRRCFNLCAAFPTLFDLIDEAGDSELDGVDSQNFKKVVDDCTLCDMCFLTKCPYVPPHEFNLDFPHLMLRYRAAAYKSGQAGFAHKQLTRTDRNGRLGVFSAALVNWLTQRRQKLMRRLLEFVTGVSKRAELPRYAARSLTAQMSKKHHAPPAGGQRKVALFSGCHCNYSDTDIGRAALYVLEKFGISCELVYPECCGMPQMETGNLSEAAAKAVRIAGILRDYIERGYDIVGLTPSCTLLMKFEWVLLLPEHEDCVILSRHAYDISEYIVRLSSECDSLPTVEMPIDGGVALHLACHARAQNMGRKGEELLRLLPHMEVKVVERCSGHGGAWGVMRDNFDKAVAVGRTPARQLRAGESVAYSTSECPLAALHLRQIMEDGQGADEVLPRMVGHPVILLARAYGWNEEGAI